MSQDIPHELFNDRSILRCSSFRVKNLERGAPKKISFKLLQGNHVKRIHSRSRPSKKLSKTIIDLPKAAKKAYNIYFKEFNRNPGHDPVLYRILYQNPNALAVETPIWTVEKGSNQSLRRIQSSSSTKRFPSVQTNSSFTGHIDLLMYDEKDETLVVADYKPEGHFLRSLPQVATYGLVLKKHLGISKIKCVSFSKEEAWVYDPDVIYETLGEHLSAFGDPPLVWRNLIPDIRM